MTAWPLTCDIGSDGSGSYFIIAKNTEYAGFDRQVMADAVLLDASVGPPHSSDSTGSLSQQDEPISIVSSATFSLLVSEAYSNLRGVMHGGAAAVIFGMTTTLALAPIARPGHWE